MSTTTRRVRTTFLGGAAFVAALLMAAAGPPASGDTFGCVATLDLPDEAVRADNQCPSTEIWVGIDRFGVDGPCVPIRGVFTGDSRYGTHVIWNRQQANGGHARDVYECPPPGAERAIARHP
ncbi:hypothetical protein INP57_26870 [Saccharopolyspora sp. HNM0986]|uniref:hypothetical protein n=1 Tax=Saccharopolyspora galaxeae TaxID=2781241 RepID=UPI00190922DF|nr:hypothetical protein [Saccharopolyspora sp. HNM0986]MBK0870432.1 hypothetical protein [Saccharopolyspora sp. HNM0986]